MHERFVELVVTARATVPVNPARGLTVMLELPAAPTLTFTFVGLADRVKSWTSYLTVAE